MTAVAFDVKGQLAHYRKPDTTATQLTYPFITPTAARGLVGSILGIEDFVTNDKIGIKLLRPVHTIAQQLSMLGKDAGTSFNRPTTVELIVNPGYRIYYTGEEYTEKLIQSLQEDHAVYSTYLGVAYALTKPELREVYEQVELLETGTGLVETSAIVPTTLINKLEFQGDHDYSRAGGFMHTYKGNRTFEKSIDFIYERKGKSVLFSPKQFPVDTLDVEITQLGDEVVCLF